MQVSFLKTIKNLYTKIKQGGIGKFYLAFFQLKIPSTQFISCNLQEEDFTETILTTSVFDCCDLKGAIFDSSNLEKSDFRITFNFTINPENNKLKGGKYRKENISGLLNNYQIVIE